MRTKTMSASDRRQMPSRAPAWTALATAFAAALLALALSALPAQSAERSAAGRSAAVPVTGGQTLLKLDSGTAAALSGAGINIRATGPAIGPAGSPVFAFPIVGGEVNKNQLGGKLVQSGGLAITAGDTTLVVKRFVIDLDSGFLTARVAGAGVRIPLLRLGAATGGVRSSPGLLLLKGVNVRLTATAAQALNQTFDTHLFERGLLIGQATVVARTGL
jgi:hypothetical protein